MISSNKYGLLASLLLFGGSVAAAVEKDTVRTTLPLSERLFLEPFVCAERFANPTAMSLRYGGNMGEVMVQGSTEKHPAYLWEHGTGETAWLVQARSFVKPWTGITLWGEAAHEREQRKDVKWNEGADFDKVFPLVPADTVGGNMRQELYRCTGGAVFQTGKWRMAAQLAYRSLTAYRRRDPRPKNDVIDLTATAGADVALCKDYAAGVFGRVGRYHQQQSVAFVRPAGRPSLYHLMGLGADYVRFAGKNTEAVLTGMQIGGGASWLLLTASGWWGTWEVNRFSFEKQLTDKGYLPINKLVETTLSMAAGYRKETAGALWGSRVVTRSARREVAMNVFDDGTANYHRVSTRSLFSHTRQTVRGELFGGVRKAGGKCAVGGLLVVEYEAVNERLQAPSRMLRYARLPVEAALWGTRQSGNCTLSAGGRVAYAAPLQRTWTVEEADEAFRTQPLVDHTFKVLSAGALQAALFLRFDQRVEVWKGTLFAKLEMFAERVHGVGTNRALQASVGISF